MYPKRREEKMNKLALAAAAALTIGTFSVAAIAQSNDDFDKYDGNKDGKLTYEEALGVNSRLNQDIFNQADANKDGFVDETEFGGLVTLAAALGTDDPSSESSEMSSEMSSSQASSAE